MAHLYRLFVLLISLLLSLPILAVSNDDEPGKSAPPKVQVSRPVLPNVPAIAGMPIKLSGINPLPWSRLINPAGPDPIRFLMQSSKDSVALGEEFEITITADLLPISPSQLFFFESQRSYSLKLLMPVEFEQAGGTYYDLVSGTLSPDGVNKISYSLRGRMVSPSKGCFRLLRGDISSTDQNLYIEKAGICVPTQNYTLIPNAKDDSLLLSTSSQARLQASSSSCNTPEIGWKGGFAQKRNEVCMANVSNPAIATLEVRGCNGSTINWYRRINGGSAEKISFGNSVYYETQSAHQPNSVTYYYFARCVCPDGSESSSSNDYTIQLNSSAPTWVDTGQSRCSSTGFNVEILLLDANQCSATYNTTKWKEFAQNHCNCYPSNQQISGPSGEVCIGSTVTLTANNCNDGGSVVWSNGATSVSTTFYAPTITTAYSFTCSYPASATCKRTSSSFTLQVKTCTNDPCAGQSTTSQWVNSGDPYCINGVNYQAQYDANNCSTNTERTRIQQVGNCSTNCSGTNPDYNYSWDIANCSSVRGWALDRNCPTSLTLKVFIDGNYVEDLLADKTREDVPPAKNLPSTYKYCGFEWTPSFSSGSHTVSIRLPNGTEIGSANLTCGTTCTTPSQPSGIHNDTQCVTNTFSLSANCQTSSCRWYDANSGGSLQGTGSIFSPNPISTTTYYVSCSNACGESSRVAVTATVNINSNAPTPTITLTQTTLTATGCTQVRWFRADDNNYYPDSPTFNIAGINNGFQLYARCVQDNCPGPSSLTFTVGSDPCSGFSTTAPTLSARVAGTTSSQSLTLTASGCPTGSSVRWYGPNSTTAVGGIWMPSFSQTSDYAAICETSNGCQGQPGQIHVTFKNPPMPQITTSAVSLCGGDAATLTANGCYTGQTVRWSTGQTGSSITVSPTSTTAYQASCVDSEVVGPTNSITIYVNNSLTITGRTDYTTGETISLTAVSSVQGATYTWYGPSGFSQPGQNLQRLSAAVSFTGNYTVVATSSQGCAGKKTVPISVTVSSFSCTCQDCDLQAVKETINPNNSFSNAKSLGSDGQNYVSESVYMDENGTSVTQTISYFDGLGRPSQNVSVGTAGGSGAGDVIAPIVYDAYGREPQKYLPYVNGATPGSFRTAGVGGVSGYYAGLPGKSGNAFSTIIYEPSPLNRIMYQTAPGSATPMKMAYRFNTAGELQLLSYDLAAQTLSVSTYGAGQLYVTEVTDENGNKTVEYKDKDGRVVGRDVSGLRTLYAYDDLGLLRCVVPPKAINTLGSSFDGFSTSNNLLFAYDYDQRGRMTRKKVPGAGITTLTYYDSNDLLKTSTDANGKTIVTTYDALNRVVSTSIASGQLQTQTFYDGSNLTNGIDASHPVDEGRLYAQSRKKDHFQGMVTGTWAAGQDGGNGLGSAIYYDELGRTIQTVSNNHKGGMDYASSKLDFVGRMLESQLSVTTSSTTITVDSRTAYEQGGRVKSVCQKVSDNQPSLVAGVPDATRFYWEPVARHTYNGIGELTTKTLGCGIQTIDYQYQMRGWLSQMNDPTNLNQGALPSQKDFFGMKLTYDGVGNINKWDYSNAQTTYAPYGLTQKPAYSYSFTYDNLNRLKTGNLTQSGNTVFTLGGANNGPITYDENGNILSMSRSMNNLSDVMTYSYASNSNKLTGLSSTQGLNLAKTSTYSYDANGNLTKDTGKNINQAGDNSIEYNHLNQPKTIHKTGGDINYTYSGAGQKLKVDFGSGKTYDYVDGLVYDKDGLEFIPTAEGRVLPPGRASTTVAIGASTSIIASNSFYRYEYHLKDHLGNLRAACRCGERQTETTPGDGYEPLVVQEQHYDPLGLDLPGLGVQPGLTANRFKYNGKEEQHGLGWIDFGARMYDPTIGRWNGVDLLADMSRRWSPYNAVYSNPLRFIDPDGMYVQHYEGEEAQEEFQRMQMQQGGGKRTKSNVNTASEYDKVTAGTAITSGKYQGIKLNEVNVNPKQNGTVYNGRADFARHMAYKYPGSQHLFLTNSGVYGPWKPVAIAFEASYSVDALFISGGVKTGVAMNSYQIVPYFAFEWSFAGSTSSPYGFAHGGGLSFIVSDKTSYKSPSFSLSPVAGTDVGYSLYAGPVSAGYSYSATRRDGVLIKDDAGFTNYSFGFGEGFGLSTGESYTGFLSYPIQVNPEPK